MALTRALRAERLKCRRNPVWLVFLILPLFPAFLGTMNYLNNLSLLTPGWENLWSQHTLFSSYFFLPAELAVFCAWQWRLEHTDHNWNCFLTAPLPVWSLYLAKLLLAMAVCVLAVGSILLLYLLCGLLIGLGAPPLGMLADWFLFGTLGAMATCAVQLLLSLVIRSFPIPVGIALLGGIAGMLLTARGYGLLWPYALLAVGMRANNPNLVLDRPLFLLSCAVFVGLCAALSLLFLSRRDAAAE